MIRVLLIPMIPKRWTLTDITLSPSSGWASGETSWTERQIHLEKSTTNSSWRRSKTAEIEKAFLHTTVISACRTSETSTSSRWSFSNSSMTRMDATKSSRSNTWPSKSKCPLIRYCHRRPAKMTSIRTLSWEERTVLASMRILLSSRWTINLKK